MRAACCAIAPDGDADHVCPVRVSHLVVSLPVVSLCLAGHLAAQCPDGAPPPCRRATAVTAPPAASVAILTFANASLDTAEAYLASGLADVVTARLSSVARLVVSSRTAIARVHGIETMRTAEIGRALGAANLVTGSVRRANGRLLVTAELVRAATGQQLWSRQFDQSQAELLSIQGAIALDVAAAVLGTLQPDERARLVVRPTQDPRAFDLYLRTNAAMWVADSRAVQQAITNLEAALRIDPGFSAALGRIAYFYGWVVNWDLPMPGLAPESVVTRGLQFADRALAADSSASDAWLGRGYLLFFRQPPDYEGALAATRRAVTLDSTDANARHTYAAILRRLGDFSSAEAEYHLALRDDPRLDQSVADLGIIAFTLRRFEEARAYYDSAIAIRDVWQHRGNSARMHLITGDTTGARRDAARILELAPLAVRPIALADVAQVEARTGDTAAARARVEPLVSALGTDDPVPVRVGYETALALVALGDRDRALALLERVRPRGAWLWSYLVMPWFDQLRADPRFQRLVREAAPPGAPRL